MVTIKSYPLLIALWAITCTAFSQSPPPGGVTGPVLWYSTDTSVNATGLRSRLGDNSVLSPDNAATGALNFHPSLVFSGQSPLRISLGDRDLRSASYFTVYQSFDTANENSIWHMTGSQQTTMVLTTDRMADL